MSDNFSGAALYQTSKVLDFEKQFGGIIYLFVCGMRIDSQNGIFTTKPNSLVDEFANQIDSV